MKKLKVAVAQLQEKWSGELAPEEIYKLNLQELKDRLLEAAQLSPDLIAAGESVTHNGIAADDKNYEEEIFAGAAFKCVSQIAAEYSCNIIYGITGKADGKIRNAAVLVDRQGKAAGVYFKVHPTANEIKEGVVPGENFPVFDIDGTKVGIMTCHDMSFPESARSLMLGGAEVIVWPTLWSGWGDDLSWTVIKSRCIDNSVFLIMASAGQDPENINPNPGVKSLSSIIDREGKILFQKSDRLPGILEGIIDVSMPRIAPWFTDGEDDKFREVVLQERKPAVYKKYLNYSSPVIVDQVKELEPQNGRNIKVTDNLFNVGRGRWGGLEPLSGECDANSWIYIDNGEAVLFDCGCESFAAQLADNIASCGIEKHQLKYIALTHTHFDHSAGVSYLQKVFAEAELIGSRVGAEYIEDRADNSLVGTAIAPPEAHCIDQPLHFDKRLNDNDTFTVGKTTFTCIELPGHTLDCMGYYADLPEGRLLVGGDVFIGDQGEVKGCIGWLDGLWKSDVYEYLKSLEKIFNIDPDLVVAGHGIPLAGKDVIGQSMLNCRNRLEYLIEMEGLGTTLPIIGGKDPSFT
ncbi:MAG: nitrilase-related carbon-nitrogen hydrolase [Planctomycetota bacterium]|jgi:predicted amidohydrolase/glyoxylase-like metal-dependent hydrolase (beta-lactamase superfamily II)